MNGSVPDLKTMFYPLSHPELREKHLNCAEGEHQWTKGRKDDNEKGTHPSRGGRGGAESLLWGALGEGSNGKNGRPHAVFGTLCRALGQGCWEIIGVQGRGSAGALRSRRAARAQ